MVKLNGENIDNYIQYDIINDSDEYKEALIKQCDNILDQMDYLIDIIGPIIEISKIISSSEKGEKLRKFIEYIPSIDFKGLTIFAKNIYESIQNAKVDAKLDTNLSTLIKNFDSSYTDEEVDIICKELIECGVINKKGEFNKEFIQIGDFEQIFLLKIDEKYLQYEYDQNKIISEELSKKIDFMAIKVSKLAVDNKKNELKEQIYERMEDFMQSLIERILDILEDKVSEQFEKLWNKYQTKKKLQKQNKENEEENDEEINKKKTIKGNEGEDEEEVQISKKANNNQINGEEEDNLVIPELNNEEIQKSKNKSEQREDAGEDDMYDINDSSNKKNKLKNENENDDFYEEDVTIKKKNKKEGDEEKEKEQINKKEKNEKANYMIQSNFGKVMQGACKSSLEYMVIKGVKNVVLPKLINI